MQLRDLLKVISPNTMVRIITPNDEEIFMSKAYFLIDVFEDVDNCPVGCISVVDEFLNVYIN